MPVIGTAGHVDHGKSTLIVALTGRDPDRWEEEKRRGLTLDLGFSWMTLPDVGEVSFVDVPGHEDFMRNMLAGIGGIDVALLVVAADEGWMAQTTEHLTVLDLLGITTGVVALTKVDRVEQERVSEVAARVTAELSATSLAGSPIVPVAAPSGVGIERLTAALGQAAGKVVPRDLGRPRLWVDRSFNVPGVGTVVTGTLLDGSLSVEDTLSIWPDGQEKRVRSLQSHERGLDTVWPGRRVAVGLVGVDRRNLGRGHMLGLPGQWLAAERALVEIRDTDPDRPIGEKGAYQAHIGSGAWNVRLQPLGAGLAVATLAGPVCLEVGDRLLVRDVGRGRIAGAAAVVDPAPRRGRELQDSLPRLSPILRQPPDESAQTLLDVRGTGDLHHLAAQTSGGRPAAAVAADGMALSITRARELTSTAELLVRRNHDERPLDRGLSKATLASRLGITIGLLARLLEQSNALVGVGDAVAVAGYVPELDASGELAWAQARERLSSAGLEVPLVRELGLGAGLVKHLERAGRLVVISGDLVFLPEQVDRLLTMLDDLAEPFTVSDFRQMAGVSRKYAVPFLEWTDKTSLTRRQGDVRVKVGKAAEADGNRTRQEP